MTAAPCCERQCRTCQQWKHYSRFRRWQDRRDPRAGTHSGPRWTFAPDCLHCEQKARNVKKNEGRAYAIIHRRAVLPLSYGPRRP